MSFGFSVSDFTVLSSLVFKASHRLRELEGTKPLKSLIDETTKLERVVREIERVGLDYFDQKAIDFIKSNETLRRTLSEILIAFEPRIRSSGSSASPRGWKRQCDVLLPVDDDQVGRWTLDLILVAEKLQVLVNTAHLKRASELGDEFGRNFKHVNGERPSRGNGGERRLRSADWTPKRRRTHQSLDRRLMVSRSEIRTFEEEGLASKPNNTHSLPRGCILIMFMFATFVFLSCILGVYFTIMPNYGYSMGDSFTLAGYVVAVGAFASTGIMAHHYPRCKCWERVDEETRMIELASTERDS